MFYLEKEVIETVENWLSKMPEDAVVGYFWFLVTTFISVSVGKFYIHLYIFLFHIVTVIDSYQ